MGLNNSTVIVALLGLSLQGACGDGAANDAFIDARLLVVTGEYQRATSQLEAFLEENADSKHASRAGLFLFKSRLAANDFDGARKWCRWTIEKHGASLEARKCEYKLAFLDMIRGETASARKGFKAVAEGRNGPLGAEASAMLQYLSGNTAEATPATQP